MRLSSDSESMASWPSEFAAAYVASLDDAGALTTSLDIHNAGSEPMIFTTALHTYFRCADALTARAWKVYASASTSTASTDAFARLNLVRDATRGGDYPYADGHSLKRVRWVEDTIRTDTS